MLRAWVWARFVDSSVCDCGDWARECIALGDGVASGDCAALAGGTPPELVGEVVFCAKALLTAIVAATRQVNDVRFIWNSPLLLRTTLSGCTRCPYQPVPSKDVRHCRPRTPSPCQRRALPPRGYGNCDPRRAALGRLKKWGLKTSVDTAFRGAWNPSNRGQASI